MRNLRFALWSLAAIALFAAGALVFGGFGVPGRAKAPGATSMASGVPLGGPFSLVDQNGSPITEAVFRGKPSAVLFGYTHCPDVCPTALMEMGGWAKALGKDAEKVRFVFVTVDPERDTPAVLKDYVSAFSDAITGISGDPAKVHAMVSDYKIYSRKVPVDGGAYSMDHTASVLLLDRSGDLAGTIARDDDKDTALAKLKRLVAS